jgi:very-short-patch-repair endonuclease
MEVMESEHIMTELEDSMSTTIRQVILSSGRSWLPEPVKEHRFHSQRKWRFDFAWPDYKIAVEVEGGTWKGGRHTRGAGFAKDCEKYNSAQLLGWRVYRFTSDMIDSGKAFETLEKIFVPF